MTFHEEEEHSKALKFEGETSRSTAPADQAVTVGNNLNNPPEKTIRECFLLDVEQIHNPVRLPNIARKDFELKPALIKLCQNYSFGGSLMEDPLEHLQRFLMITRTIRINGVSDEVIKLELFPWSLRDDAWIWFLSCSHGCFTTWTDFAQAFFAQYCPVSKTRKLRMDLLDFKQWPDEHLSQSWVRFKELRRKCPHHGLDAGFLIEIFFQGLCSNDRLNLGAAAGGSLASKSPSEAENIIEKMSSSMELFYGRQPSRPPAGAYHDDDVSKLKAQVRLLLKRISELGGSSSSSTAVQAAVCQDYDGWHDLTKGPLGAYDTQQEQLNVISQGRGGKDPYSHTYNPGWQNHPNFGWDGQQRVQQPIYQRFQGLEPVFQPQQNQRFSGLSHQQNQEGQPAEKGNNSLHAAVGHLIQATTQQMRVTTEYMQTNKEEMSVLSARLDRMEVSNKQLETHIGQMVGQVNVELSSNAELIQESM